MCQCREMAGGLGKYGIINHLATLAPGWLAGAAGDRQEVSECYGQNVPQFVTPLQASCHASVLPHPRMPVLMFPRQGRFLPILPPSPRSCPFLRERGMGQYRYMK